jgi:hypothetical protein
MMSEGCLSLLLELRVSIDSFLVFVGFKKSEGSFSLFDSSGTYSKLLSFIIFYFKLLELDIDFFYFFSEAY